MKKSSAFRAHFGNMLKPYRWKIVILSCLTVLQAVLQVALAVITRFVIDAALGDIQQFPLWGAALLVDSLLLILTHAILLWFSGRTTDRFSAAMRRGILRSAVFSPGEKYHQYHSGELLSRAMDDVRAVCEGATQAIPALIGQIARLAAAFTAVILIYPSVAVVLFAVAAAMTVGVALLRPYLKNSQRQVRQQEGEVMSTMQEDLQQLELIQSLGVQSQILKRFGAKISKSLSVKSHRRRWTVATNASINSISQIGSGLLLLWGCVQIGAGVLTYGSLTSMLQLLALFRSPVLSLSGLWTQFAGIEVAMERLRELLEEPAPQEHCDTALKVEAVVFENVTFAYPDDQIPVLEQFSTRFPLDGWACLTGMSGKGKSTLFKLILGLYKPQGGRVYLETDRGELECSTQTRCLFAYVPQDYALFSGTVLENMQLVDPDLDSDRLNAVLKLAGAEFLLDTAGQEHTVLGENNTGLSMGQLQRLAIARAILTDRPILLLDECTSALDMQTEKTVLQNLQTLGKKAILVTHRPEALEDLPGIVPVSIEQ